jgi:arylformamidase
MHTLYREFTSQAQIDAQYNVALTVSDAPAHLRYYVERSRLARETLPSHLDVAFGPTLDETLDIFPSTPGAPGRGAPVFVFIHGGYWRAFTSKEFSFVALGLHALGITTAVVNYSLCPKVSIDEITRQVRAAVAWVLRNIGQYGGDPLRVAVGGHSAGGHLSAMCLQSEWSDEYGLPADPLAAAVLISGIYDVQPLRYSYLQPQIQLDDGVIRRNSPLFGARPCTTPTLITWGDQEPTEFARQATSMHEVSRALGNDTELFPQTDANHFSAIHGFQDPTSSLCRWLAEKLSVAP